MAIKETCGLTKQEYSAAIGTTQSDLTFMAFACWFVLGICDFSCLTASH